MNDSFDQWRYRIASAVWGPGVGIPSFFILCAEYFIRYHRKLAVVRREIREEATTQEERAGEGRESGLPSKSGHVPEKAARDA